jgi:hypothetical protein
VPAMAPRRHGTPQRARRRPARPSPPPRSLRRPKRRPERRAARGFRRFALLTLVGCVLVATALLTAFGERSAPAAEVLAPPKRLLAASPPRPQVVATVGSLRLQLPVSQSRLTAIGYHAVSDGALALDPVGRQGNEGFFRRVVHRLFGGGGGGLVYYRLSGGSGTATGSLDVGAAPATDVYAPVDGTIVGITDYVVDGRAFGARIDVQPSSAPSMLVSLTHLRPDPSLTVGSAVAAGSSKLGAVIDLSSVERQALARYTQDAGNHVAVEVHQAAALAVP